MDSLSIRFTRPPAPKMRGTSIVNKVMDVNASARPRVKFIATKPAATLPVHHCAVVSAGASVSACGGGASLTIAVSASAPTMITVSTTSSGTTNRIQRS